MPSLMTTSFDREPCGVPMTTPTTNPSDARESLRALSASHPGEIFILEATGGKEMNGELIVSWLPSWYLPFLLGNFVINSFSVMAPLEWPVSGK